MNISLYIISVRPIIFFRMSQKIVVEQTWHTFWTSLIIKQVPALHWHTRASYVHLNHIMQHDKLMALCFQCSCNWHILGNCRILHITCSLNEKNVCKWYILSKLYIQYNCHYVKNYGRIKSNQLVAHVYT